MPSLRKPEPLWRGLEELAETQEFKEFLHREFPREASVWESLGDPVSRRAFLRVMGASLALAGLGGLTGCVRMPPDQIVPFAANPPDASLAPGEPLFFASATTLRGYARGILIETHEGRPTKIEGNPLHPASGGATDIFSQAELLALYDPDRSRTVRHLGEASTWDAFAAEISRKLRGWAETGGEGVHFLSEPRTSPTLAALLAELRRKWPKLHWHVHDPTGSASALAGSRHAFGRAVKPLYRLERARCVLSLDADFLGPGPEQVTLARAFSEGRRSTEHGAPREFTRLYCVESTFSLTGANADHRLALRPSQIEGLALALARELGVGVRTAAPGWTGAHSEWLAAAAADLRAQGARAVVIPGDTQSRGTQLLAHAINEKLGSLGNAVEFIESPELAAEASDSGNNVEDLGRALDEGKVQALFILGGNPAYDLPASFGFARRLGRVAFRARLGLHEDETSDHCHWHLPQAHFLETWGDARSGDGTASVQQPVTLPMYDGRSVLELLALLLGRPGATARELVRATHPGADWEKSLNDGLVSGSASPPVSVRVSGEALAAHALAEEPAAPGTFEASIRPDPTLWDGSYANNGWLQELPKPLLQLTWDNAVLLSPVDADRLGLQDGDRVELSLGSRAVIGPALRLPGHPNGTVTLHLGHGRSRAGLVGNHHGFDVHPLLEHPGQNSLRGLILGKVEGAKWKLALTHFHHSMEGREPIARGTLTDYRRDPESIVRAVDREEPETILRAFEYARPPENPRRDPPEPRIEAWAMVIDLTACIGCKTCTIACQAENNIPIVGKDQVLVSREMHWIRVDRYFEGSAEAPRAYFQPVPCMHCEAAPCELVCPTAATNHSHDGLNQMIYNRCVGTRYCSNNCPYKVRRFNFFEYPDAKSVALRPMRNPEVTVRTRGVMEKCTYCIQRIQAVRIRAEKENRGIRDGEIVPACAQACPTRAISFGDRDDPGSRVATLRRLKHNYSLFNDLGTRPRTTYLARLLDPNPRLSKGRA